VVVHTGHSRWARTAVGGCHSCMQMDPRAFEGELFTRQEAIAAGIRGQRLTELVRAGAIARVARGVYRPGVLAPVDPVAICRSWKVALSHVSAAAWLGADLPFAPDQMHVSAERSRGRPAEAAPGIRLHRVASAEVVKVGGVWVTSPAQTLLDVARSLPLREAVAIGDSLVRIGRLTYDEAVSAAARLPAGRGRRVAIAVAELLDGRAESVFESMTRVEVVVAGLSPFPQFDIYDGDRWIARVDFAWVRERLVLECDGYEFHADRAAFHADRRRWNALVRAGWTVLIVTWRDIVEDPQYVVELVSRVIAA